MAHLYGINMFFCVINKNVTEFLTALLVCNATIITSVIVTSPTVTVIGETGLKRIQWTFSGA